VSKFDVYVVPRSVLAGPDGRRGGMPRLRVKSPPAEGRANTDAARILTDLFRTKVRLAAGARSRKKTFEIDLPKQVVDERLRQVFGS
jgi:uncharacterized protein (TIGR00251 family)